MAYLLQYSVPFHRLFGVINIAEGKTIRSTYSFTINTILSISKVGQRQREETCLNSVVSRLKKSLLHVVCMLYECIQ